MIEKKWFRFWYYWILSVSVINIIVGIIIAFLPASIFFEYHTNALGETFLNGFITEEAEKLRTFFFGIIGATIAGYFLLQTMIVIYPFRNREKWAWHAIFWALLLWFITDSTLSILHGAFFNVWMINIPSLLLTLLPLLMTVNVFHHPDV